MFPRQSVKMHLSTDERRFLLAVQRGDIRATERYGENTMIKGL
jgi:hypothetical protein